MYTCELLPTIYHTQGEHANHYTTLRLSKEDKQHNGQKKKNKRTNNDLQNIDKTKDRVTRTPLKSIGKPETVKMEFFASPLSTQY
jgi:hypothetical protein